MRALTRALLALATCAAPAVALAPERLARAPVRGALRAQLAHRSRLARGAPARGAPPARVFASAPPAQRAPLAEVLDTTGAAQRFVLVGGKGGVGKTSTASAVAIRCAESGLRTLVASTDPAHSLGDALQLDLSGGKPIAVPGLDGLDALEIDPTEAIERFRAALAAFRPADLGLGGLAEDIVSQLGLEDFADILDEPPPGLDELLALAEVVELSSGGPKEQRLAAAAVQDELDDFDARLAARAAASGGSGGSAGGGGGGGERVRYERVILDTAPTGHTLRLLSLPQFIDSLLTKLLALRARLGGVLGAAASLGLVGGGIEAKVEEASRRVEEVRARVQALRALLNDAERAEFCVVTVPTEVAMAETARLLTTLAAQRVCVRHLVVNQIVESSNAPSYLERLRKGQDAIARRLLGRASAAVAADERAAPGAAGSDWAGVTVSPVAYYDLELRGVYPLRFLGERAFGAPQWAGFTGADGGGARRAGEDEAGLASGAAGCRFVVMGGKGGVGKTSSAAALALRCADAGLRTLIVSTDPAHSLGDVLQLSLAGRQEPVPVEDASHRRLFALEVDPDEAARAFQKLIRRLGSEADADGGGGGGEGGKGMLDGIAAQLGLADFASVLDTLPPGADELVALAKVVSLLEDGALGEPFDRIVIDTAPTGHTLRLLRFPDFLDRFVTRLLKLRAKLSGAGALLGSAAAAMNSVFGGRGGGGGLGGMGRGFGGGGGGGGGGGSSGGPGSAAASLEQFRAQMRLLSAILHDPARSEFCIVAIPTELALLESTRLLKALRADGVSVNHLVLNRIVNADGEGGEAFVRRLSAAHAGCVAQARAIGERSGVSVTTLPFFDTEVVGLPGLRALGAMLFR